MTEKTYGWIPDTPDQRDYLYGSLNAVPVDLPEKVDLRQYCSKIEDQGNLGSCTANAAVALIELLENKHGLTFNDMSRLFIYYNTRVLQNTVKQDSGASIRLTIKALNKYGVCHEVAWPYTISKFKNKPTTSCFKSAAARKVTSYMRLNNLQEMKQCLADGFGFNFGIGVYESFESDEVAKTGIVPIPLPDEECYGGHALAAVGYDNETQMFIVRNSWGTRWGDSGYCYIPYKFMTNKNLADDFWTVKAGTKF